MVTRKTTDKKKEKILPEGPPQRKFDPKKQDFASMADAIVDGKFVGTVGGEIVVERLHNGRKQKMICTVKEINGDKVDTWDETLHRWFNFTPKDLLNHNIAAKLNPPQESK
jgi:hypothetical protein